MLNHKLSTNNDVISTDIKHLQESKSIVNNVSYTEINQEKNCQDIKENWMLLTQTSLL
jgi:hypothetical protein